jgi:hypothetical protein
VPSTAGPRCRTTGGCRWSYGALSYLAWEPYSASIQSIAAGHSDVYITQFANAVRARLAATLANSDGLGMYYIWVKR